jgi:hypothetical protein
MSEGKPIRDEDKRPAALLWMKSKKERGDSENITRVPTPVFIAPLKTPAASKLRKDAQAKALAAEKMAAASESELLEEPDVEEEHEMKIKKKKRTEEEEEEDQRETAILQAELREQDRLEYEEDMLLVEDSEEEDEVIVPAFLGDARRSKEGWLKAWTKTYDLPAASLSLFARAVLIPPCRGVAIEGDLDANEILIVGDLGREDLHSAVGHVLFLVQNGRRIRTTFNTTEGHRIRVEEGDATLEKVLTIFINVVEFAVEGEAAHLFPDVNDPAWRSTWENVRPDLAPHFTPKANLDSSRMFTATDTFSGSRRREGSVCEARSARDGRAFVRLEGATGSKARVGRMLETPRERGKPTVLRLVFDGRKGVESHKRDFYEYMRSKEEELRAAWLLEEKEPESPGRWTEGRSLGLALRPTDPASIAAAYRRALLTQA